MIGREGLYQSKGGDNRTMRHTSYMTPAQVGAALTPPRSAERVRQLCRRGDIPFVSLEEGTSGSATARTKYLIRREDMEVFRDKVDPFRPKGRPLGSTTKAKSRIRPSRTQSRTTRARVPALQNGA